MVARTRREQLIVNAVPYLTLVFATAWTLATVVQPVGASRPVAQAKGMDLAAAVNLVREDVKAEGRLFVPGRATRVRAVIATISWGLGDEVYADPEIRLLAESTDSALLLARVSSVTSVGVNNRPVATEAAIDAFLGVLRRLADDSSHPELVSAPFLFWAHSAAGNFAAAFAMRHPDQTVAVVLYQSAAAGVVRTDEDVARLARTPLMIIEGIVDPQFDATLSETLVKRGRAIGGAWAFVLQRDAPHGSEPHRKLANALLIPWAAGVLRHRLPATSKTLLPVQTGRGWVGSHDTGAIAQAGSPAATVPPYTSWFPDELTAIRWQAFIGHGGQ